METRIVSTSAIKSITLSVLFAMGAMIFSPVTTSAAPTQFIQGGNSFSTSAILGTNDNFGLIFETNNIERARIDNLGNLGIGTNNPEAKLNVVGGEFWLFNNGQSPRIVLGDNGATGQYGFAQWDSANDYYRLETDGTNGIKIKGNNVAIGNIFPSEPFLVGSGIMELFRVNGNGFVGVGTSLPSYKFDVQGGQINSSGGLCIAGDCKTSWSQVQGSSTIPGGQNGYIQFNDNSGFGGDTNLFWDNLNKKLGIGTAAPITPLEIQADGLVSNATPQLLIRGKTNPNNQLQLGYNTGSGGVEFGFIQANHVTQAPRSLSLNPFGGNVGIGISPTGPSSEPNSKLHISAGGVASGARIRLSELPPVSNVLIQTALDGGVLGWQLRSSGTSQEFFDVSDSTGSPLTDVSGVKFRINTISGNVGVGTLSPNTKVQITGGDVSVTSQGSGVILKATDGPNCYRVTVDNLGILSTALAICP